MLDPTGAHFSYLNFSFKVENTNDKLMPDVIYLHNGMSCIVFNYGFDNADVFFKGSRNWSSRAGIILNIVLPFLNIDTSLAIVR
jgi:hypothetical protein